MLEPFQRSRGLKILFGRKAGVASVGLCVGGTTVGWLGLVPVLSNAPDGSYPVVHTRERRGSPPIYIGRVTPVLCRTVTSEITVTALCAMRNAQVMRRQRTTKARALRSQYWDRHDEPEYDDQSGRE